MNGIGASDARGASQPALLSTFRGLGRRDLETALLRGSTPDIEALIGWEFRGLNTPAWARVLGIRKFIKGFFRPPGRSGLVLGYNSPVWQNRLREPWIAQPDDNAPKRFGYFRVAPVEPTSRDCAYLHAVLLDYGRGGNPGWDPTRGLRDYLVQLHPSRPDIFLGKAYYALGPARIGVSFFVLERHRRIRNALTGSYRPDR